MLYFITRNLALILCKLFFRITAHGKENIPKKGAFILAANHVSYLDPIALAVASSRRLNFMARKELFENRFFAWLIRGCHAFEVKRKTADLSSLKTAINKLQEGKPVLIFPSGTRTDNSKITSYNDGAGFLSLKSNCPIVPVYIKGSNQAMPKNGKGIRFKKVTIYFGRMISPLNFSEVDISERKSRITQKVVEAINAMS